MVQVGTKLKVLDNSGVVSVCCIKLLNVGKRKYAKAGDLILVSIGKKKFNKYKPEKEKMCRAVVVCVKKPYRRLGGEVIRFSENCVVLVKKDCSPIGTRVLGPVMNELREKKFMKIVSLALMTV